ncbi:MAG: hypothetical protein M3446_03970 [Actinomycetota bacterium]|nr:hypothetical protein [Actinomycetota bacterium]
MAVYRRFASIEDLLVTVASTPMSGRRPPPDTGALRAIWSRWCVTGAAP